MTGRAPRRRRAKLLLVLVGAALALIAFEAALQVGAYWLWRSAQREGHGDAAVRVLCVGDSFTWGMGADSAQGSYPMQLEQRLRAAMLDVAVVNGGWPGQHSRDVAEKLARQLAEHRPKLVYVLIGTNDPWKRPKPVTLEECRNVEAAAFPVLWRTGQFLALIRHAVFGGGDAAPGFLGVWHTADREMTFEAEGRFLAGDTELRWVADGDALRVLMPNAREVRVAWRREDDRLILQSAMWPQPLELRPGPLGEAGPLVQARRLVAERRFDAALPLLDEARRTPADEVAARELLVTLHVESGDLDRAGEHLDWLGERYAAGRDTATGEALAHALLAAGRTDDGVAVAIEVFTREPASFRAAQVLMGAGLAAGKTAAVEAAFEQALQILPAGHARRAELFMTLAILRKDRPEASLTAILEGVLAGADENVACQFLFAAREQFTAARLETCLQRLPIEPAQRDDLRSLYATAMRGADRSNDILAGHLGIIVRLCADAGAQAVLLTYPNDYPGHDEVVQRVAGELGVGQVDVRPVFDAALRDRPREDLFIPDGHCTSAGYALMADVIAADAVRRLR